MKKLKFFTLAIACAMMFAACGSNGSEKEESPLDEVLEDIDETDVEDEPMIEETKEVEQATSSSNDWNAVLDEYEELVDEYIKFAKKVENGDMSAMAEYTSCLEKSSSFSEKLDKAGNDLTAAQLARYQKITLKMTKAAM